MNVLVVDVGGTNVKILATGQEAPRKFPSGPSLTPERMVLGVKQLVAEWKYEVVSIGYPGPVLRVERLRNRITWGKGGSGSTSTPHSGARSSSSMMRPCKPWGATTAERCFSWVWEPVLAPL